MPCELIDIVNEEMFINSDSWNTSGSISHEQLPEPGSKIYELTPYTGGSISELMHCSPDMAKSVFSEINLKKHDPSKTGDIVEKGTTDAHAP